MLLTFKEFSLTSCFGTGSKGDFPNGEMDGKTLTGVITLHYSIQNEKNSIWLSDYWHEMNDHPLKYESLHSELTHGWGWFLPPFYSTGLIPSTSAITWCKLYASPSFESGTYFFFSPTEQIGGEPRRLGSVLLGRGALIENPLLCSTWARAQVCFIIFIEHF